DDLSPALYEEQPDPVEAASEFPPDADTAEPVDVHMAEIAAPESTLPSFLSDYAPPVATSSESMAEPEPDPAPEPTSPKPRIVDVPDDPDPETLMVEPSALSKLAHVDRLTDAQRKMLRPLVAQLTALRDQMANSR
ncbi:MAG: hypothetical protein AB3N17_18000, partial [Tateyamaria sp.]